MSPLLLLLLALAGTTDRFPHERHARLFPLCDGCHAGAERAGAPVYPDAAVCARCHDGTRNAEVQWSAPAPGRSNLRFTHAAHAGEASCAACHETTGGRMSIARPSPETCFACHGGQAHLEGGDRCRLCHVALTATQWSASRIASLPRPAEHATPAFLHTHGRQAGTSACATCHARESCERCHPNAERVPAITRLQRDARIATLTRGRPGEYPAPTSHDESWDWQHGARANASCGNCHGRASCTACHPRGALLDSLPDATRGVTHAAGTRVHPAQFEQRHAAAGATDAGCMGCHERATCDGCHAARRARFHAPNFVARHGPEAYGADTQCSSCHSTEVFCRACHAGTGRAPQGRNVAFHNASPLWLIGHGQAARQSLEGCTSCHAQADCARCHSSRGGWGVNPHGPGFEAARMQQQNRQTCLRCHRSGSVSGT